ncbi:MAG: DUF808 domain-containing protein [Bryobacteraceae bacterium]|nr:DUF808 domain-containing protein [Bryobacteraceae bacterium]
MSTGLLALLDDVVALTKLAAASLDDAATQAAKAGSKAAGIVIDDAAVTPRYVVGLAASRELPIIRQIAVGSLKNKLLWLLPGALLLSYTAPWAITPLLMVGGAFLCYEGYHKVRDLIQPHAPAPDLKSHGEDERVASAIRTDFILSAEIMAIALSTVATASLGMQAGILAVVGVGMTVAVYGAVALIVKADDAGVALANSPAAAVRVFGRGLVHGMPYFLQGLSLLGMLAMLWVGGGILIHGLHELGVHAPEKALQGAASGATGALAWLIQASLSGVVGLAVGALCDALHQAVRPKT